MAKREVLKKGHQTMFYTLALLIRAVDFILAGGGYFKNMVWIFLAAVVGTVVEHHRHLGGLGWLLFAGAAILVRFLTEAILVGLSIWVSRNLLAIENQNFPTSITPTPDSSAGFKEYEQRHNEIIGQSKE